MTLSPHAWLREQEWHPGEEMDEDEMVALLEAWGASVLDDVVSTAAGLIGEGDSYHSALEEAVRGAYEDLGVFREP